MRTPVSLSLWIVVLAGLMPSCTGLYGRAYGAFMQPTLRGDMGLSTTSLPTVINAVADVQDELGLDNASAPYARVELGTPLLTFTGSAFQYSSEGSGTLGGAFGNIPGGVNVASEADVLNIKGAVSWNLVDVWILRISPGLAVDYFDVATSVTPNLASLREEVDFQAPVPMLFVQTEVELGPLTGLVDAGGMTIDVDDIDATIWDLEAMLRWNVTGPLELLAGYRFISIDGEGTVDGQHYEADMLITGWFVGGGVSF